MKEVNLKLHYNGERKGNIMENDEKQARLIVSY